MNRKGIRLLQRLCLNKRENDVFLFPQVKLNLKSAYGNRMSHYSLLHLKIWFKCWYYRHGNTHQPKTYGHPIMHSTSTMRHNIDTEGGNCGCDKKCVARMLNLSEADYQVINTNTQLAILCCYCNVSGNTDFIITSKNKVSALSILRL